MIAIPVARRLARAAVNDQILGALGDVLVKIVHQHAHGGFLLPSLAGERGAAGGANASVGGCLSFSVNRHGDMVVRGDANHQ